MLQKLLKIPYSKMSRSAFCEFNLSLIHNELFSSRLTLQNRKER